MLEAIIGTISIWGKVVGGLLLFAIIPTWFKFQNEAEGLGERVEREVYNRNGPVKYLFKGLFSDALGDEMRDLLDYRGKKLFYPFLIKSIILFILGILFIVSSFIVPKLI